MGADFLLVLDDPVFAERQRRPQNKGLLKQDLANLSDPLYSDEPLKFPLLLDR